MTSRRSILLTDDEINFLLVVLKKDEQQNGHNEMISYIRTHLMFRKRMAKKCLYCLKVKSKHNFYLKPGGYLQSWCKSCAPKAQKEYRDKKKNLKRDFIL